MKAPPIADHELVAALRLSTAPGLPPAVLDAVHAAVQSEAQVTRGRVRLPRWLRLSPEHRPMRSRSARRGRGAVSCRCPSPCC
jgi:hypothetical protein